MTTNNIKHYFLAFCVGCGAVSLTTACSEWDDHYEDPITQANGQQSLWQTIQQKPELSDFSEVLSKTMVLRQHKKTDISYADLLNGSQTYTVLAPVNGTFNKDSVLALLETDKGDSMVVRSFVGNHLSFSLTNDTEQPTDFFLLNTKRASIGNGQVMGVNLKEKNMRAKGGILHVLENTLPYRHNLYEVLINNDRYTKIGEQLTSYEEDEFSPSLSVEGDMVDGEQLYVDSVFIERNKLLELVGRIADEDSTFYMLVPTTDEWQRVWQEAMEYFRYDSKVEGGDSLQRLYANSALLADAIFSRTIQASPEDSLKTREYDKKYPQYHVFHKPFEEGGIFYGATPSACSNGTLYTTDKWPFTPQMTYQREIRCEGEAKGVIIDNTLSSYTTRHHVADSVSENEYLVISPEKNTSNWTMTFKLSNTLAGTYDICIVTLPQTVYDPTRTNLKPCQFQAEINYVDENGNAQTYDCGNKQKFKTRPEVVDTVVVAEDFKFPVCNYGQTNNKVTVKLRCSILAKDTPNYSREMLLDCIYLRPKKMKSEE